MKKEYIQFFIGIIIFAIVIKFLGGCTYKFNSQEPIWYIDPPAVEGSTVVSGYGKSKHKQLALDMATMAAKRTAAHMIASEVKGKSKYYLSRGSSQNTEVAFIETINMRIENFERVKVNIKENGSNFEVYVMLAIPHQFTNKLIEELDNEG